MSLIADRARTGADRRPLAGSYAVAVALALLGLCPFIVVSTAGQLIENDLIRDLHATMFDIELTNALANAGYAFGAVLAADLIQRLPARRLYLACETAFLAGALLSGFAPGIVAFLVGRTVQGVATGMLLVAALPPLVTRFGARKLPATAAVVDLGLFGMVTLGPLAGGISAATGQWRTMFVILAGLTAAGIVLGVLGFAGGEETSRIGFDWSAIPVALVSTVLPFLGIAWIAKGGFSSPGFLVPLGAGLLGLGTLLVRQFRKPGALMPLKLIAHTLPVTGILAAMAAGGAVTALLDIGAVYLLEVGQHPPLVTGAVLTTQVAGVLLAAVLFSRFLRTRWLPAFALTGVGLVAVGGVLLLALSPGRDVWLVAGAGLLLGFGAGAGVAPALFMAGLSAPSDRLGPTFALVELLRSEAAYLLAPVVLQIALMQSNTAHGLRIAAAISIGVCLLGGGMALTVLLTGGAHPHPPDLQRWIEEKEPAYDSPPLAATVRST